MKRLIKIIKHKEESEEDVYTRWERDYDLVPNSVHGLFYEYLELGMYVIPHVHVLMRDERRKKERSKQGQTNNKAKQHCIMYELDASFVPLSIVLHS